MEKSFLNSSSSVSGAKSSGEKSSKEKDSSKKKNINLITDDFSEADEN